MTARLPLIAAVLATLAVPSAANAAGAPRPVPLDRGWTFALTAGAPAPVTLPHVFDPNPSPSVFAGQSGTYRLTFTPPRLPAGFAWGLRFEQVRRVATVSLNGRTIGVHRDPYVPFTIPATGLRPGAPNELVVAVDNHKGPELREGWWNWGGITRPVALVPLGPVVLHDAGVLPQLTCSSAGRCSAKVLVDGWVENRSRAPVAPRVSVALRAPRGGAVTTASARLRPLRPGEYRRVRFTTSVSSPQLWAPGHPRLYSTTVRTFAGARLAQVDRLHTGLRSVAVKDGHLLLNGRRVQLRGASIQEDVPGRGPALLGPDMDRIVSELRAVHANVTRAHYLLNPQLLDRLDRAGILVWTQAPIYHRDVLLRTPAQRSAALATVRGTVLAARDHPSVLTYSVANELSPTPDAVAPTREFLTGAAALARDLDPTLPVSLDVLSYPGLPYEKTYRAFDMLGINDYFGWYGGRPDHSTAKLSGLGPFLAAMHQRYPDTAMVITEFGAEATELGPVTRKQTYAFQSNYLRRTLGVVGSTGFVDGAIYWTLREFAVKPFWDGGSGAPGIRTDSIHNKGLIAYAGATKPAFSVARRLFADTPLYVPEPVAGPRGGSDLPGAAQTVLLLLALAGMVLFDLWCFLAIRDDWREAPADVVELMPDEVAAARERRVLRG